MVLVVRGCCVKSFIPFEPLCCCSFPDSAVSTVPLTTAAVFRFWPEIWQCSHLIHLHEHALPRLLVTASASRTLRAPLARRVSSGSPILVLCQPNLIIFQSIRFLSPSPMPSLLPQHSSVPLACVWMRAEAEYGAPRVAARHIPKIHQVFLKGVPLYLVSPRKTPGPASGPSEYQVP